MSRHTIRRGVKTIAIYGNDHALGRFLDIVDERYANHPADTQGEGYIYSWTELFGVSLNLANLTPVEARDLESRTARRKINNFISSLGPASEYVENK